MWNWRFEATNPGIFGLVICRTAASIVLLGTSGLFLLSADLRRSSRITFLKSSLSGDSESGAIFGPWANWYPISLNQSIEN